MAICVWRNRWYHTGFYGNIARAKGTFDRARSSIKEFATRAVGKPPIRTTVRGSLLIGRCVHGTAQQRPQGEATCILNIPITPTICKGSHRTGAHETYFWEKDSVWACWVWLQPNRSVSCTCICSASRQGQACSLSLTPTWEYFAATWCNPTLKSFVIAKSGRGEPGAVWQSVVWLSGNICFASHDAGVHAH